MPTQAMPQWLSDAFASVSKKKKAKTRPWIDPAKLPPCVLCEHTLTDAEISILLGELIVSTTKEVSPLVRDLKEHEARCDEFLWAVYEQWVGAGESSKDKWIILAVALLGSNSLVVRLSDLFGDWRRRRLYDRAKFGVDCLVANGGTVALWLIDRMSCSNLQSLSEYAFSTVTKLASAQEVSIPQWEDRVIPDCTSSSDPSSLRSAVEQFEALRLEQLMVADYRWSWQEFSKNFLSHPVMCQLCTRILWGVFDLSGQMQRAFQVNEKTIELENESLKLDERCIGIVHPLHLSNSELAAWVDIWHKSGLKSPFEQFQRPVFLLQPGEVERAQLERVPPGIRSGRKLMKSAAEQGWGLGCARAWTSISYFVKHLTSLNLTAIVQLNPVIMEEIAGEPSSFEILYFQKGLRTSDLHFVDERLPLKSISPVTISEMVAELTEIMKD